MLPDDPRHGTPRGYSAHRREGSDPCSLCRAAAADYERQRFYDSHLGRQRLVSVAATRRRIRALQAIGWPTRLITAELGYASRDALAPLLYDAEWVTRSRAKKIADLYDRLCMTPGPSNITKIRATRAGFLPPLAWDDIEAGELVPDKPCADNKIDEVLVMRIVDGDMALATSATPAERAEVARRWALTGRSLAELGRLAGWKIERYYKVAA